MIIDHLYNEIFIIASNISGKLSVIKEGMKGSQSDAPQFAFALYNGLWAYGGWFVVIGYR